jgi:hypothetical protein
MRIKNTSDQCINFSNLSLRQTPPDRLDPNLVKAALNTDTVKKKSFWNVTSHLVTRGNIHREIRVATVLGPVDYKYIRYQATPDRAIPHNNISISPQLKLDYYF